MSEQMSGISSRDDLIGAGIFWRIVHRDYEDGKLKYVGKNTVIDALESSATWTIWKYFYQDDILVSVEGPLEGAWSLREDLGWVGLHSQYFPSGAIESDQEKANIFLEEILVELRAMNEKLDVGLEEL